jgi:hypothetical protein
MINSRNSDRNDQSVDLIEDVQLDAVVGGASPQLLAGQAVGGWTMKDIWTRPTLGTYH